MSIDLSPFLNKVICGDCLEVMKQMPDESVDCVITDPPYNINFIPQRKTFEGILNDNMDWDSFEKWILPILKEIYRVLKNNSVFFVFTGFSSSSYYYYYLIMSNKRLDCQIIWVKNNIGIGYHFRPQHEDIWVCFKGEPETPKKALSSVLFEKKVNGIDLLHSCQKPEKLISLLMKQYTTNQSIILDPFLGSGTTAVACKLLKRNFIGIELAKDYYKIAEERLKNIPDKSIFEF